METYHDHHLHTGAPSSHPDFDDAGETSNRIT